jgi:hypothetical protein
MHYFSEINIENCDFERMEIVDHIVSQDTIYDEKRGKYHITITVLNKTNGNVYSVLRSQNEEDSFFHKTFVPAYKLCCKKTDTTPRIKE